MGRFEQGVLSDMDCISAWLLSQDKSGKTDEVEFAKLLDQRREQVHEEVIKLSKDLEMLEISNKISNEDFYRQAAIYLLSNQEGCTMVEAEAIYTTLEEKRDAGVQGDMGKIIKALELPKYDSPKPKSKVEKTHEESQKEEHQDETVEWIRSGEVKLELLKKKFQGR